MQRLLEKLRLSNNLIKPVILRYDNTKVNKYCMSLEGIMIKIYEHEVSKNSMNDLFYIDDSKWVLVATADAIEAAKNYPRRKRCVYRYIDTNEKSNKYKYNKVYNLNSNGTDVAICIAEDDEQAYEIKDYAQDVMNTKLGIGQ